MVVLPATDHGVLCKGSEFEVITRCEWSADARQQAQGRKNAAKFGIR